MFEEPKYPTSSLAHHEALAGGVVYNADIACAIGEILLKHHYDHEQLLRQMPLTAVDRGDYWRVEGSWNRDGKLDGFGPFYLSITKYDGQVKDLGVWAALHPHPKLIAYLKERSEKKE